MKTITLFAVVLLLAVTRSQGVTIAQWTFETDVQAPSSVELNVSASAFTLSSGGVSFVSGNPGRAISGTAWTGADGSKWWEFTVTALPGYVLDLTSLTFDDQRSSTGPTSWSVSVNGVTAISAQATHGAFSTSPNSVDLSAAAFQNLSSANVRIFGFGASSGSGTWRLDDVTLAGSSTEIRSVPESLPLGFAAFALLAVLLFSRCVASSVMK